MNRLTPWLLVSLSALIYGSAVLWPTYCFWMVFVFLIPIFYISFRSPHLLTFSYGLWWGLQFFCINFYGVAKVFHQVAQSDLRILVPIGFIVYVALHSGLWFWLATYVVSCRKNPSPLWIGLSWFMVTGLYFYWVRYGVFWVLGIFVGNPFGSPLLLLAEYPLLLMSLPIVTETGLLIALILGQLGIAYGLYKKSLVYCGVAGCYLLIFLLGALLGPSETEVPQYVNTIGYVNPPSKLLPIEQQIVDLHTRITKLLSSNPALHTIILPESTLQIRLDIHPDIIHYFSSAIATKDINIFIGANRSGVDKDCNSLYLIKNGSIVSCYDKKILMPLFEYVEFPWNQCAYFNNLFLKKWPGFDCPKKSLDLFQWTPQVCLVPRLCSELYLSLDHHDVSYDPDYPILFATNEAWFSDRHYQKLFYLYAVFQAIQSKRDIIYVGHKFGRWISRATGRSIGF